MVDLAVLQSVSYIAGALGVCVAATYYVMNLRETNRSRRVSMTNLLLLTFMSEEGQRRWGELLNMEWDNYDDFEKKYGSDFNLDNFAKRQSTFYLFDTLGSLLKSGLADRDTLYTVTQVGVPWTWAKFKSVLMENRRLYAGRDAFKDFEYLADEMMKMKMQRDPSYKVPETFARYVTVK